MVDFGAEQQNQLTSQHDVGFAKTAQQGHCYTLAVSTFDDCRLSNGRTADTFAPVLLLRQVSVWQSAVLWTI